MCFFSQSKEKHAYLRFAVFASVIGQNPHQNRTIYILQCPNSYYTYRRLEATWELHDPENG